MNPAPPAARAPGPALGLCLAVALVFANGMGGRFFFDDLNAIVHNPGLRSLWPPGPAAFLRVDCTAAHRPIVAYSLAVNYALSGLQPWSYHLFNILFHALSTLLLFGLTRRTLRRPPLATTFGDRADGLSLAIALVFALHPLQTESVTYIMGRAESLMGLFYLLALYAAARSLDSPRPARWQALSVAAAVLALGAKEAAVTAPLVIVLYEFTFAADPPARLWRRRRGFYLALAATWVPAAFWVAHHPHTESIGFSLGVSPTDYALTQAGVLCYYLQRVLWPWPLALDLDWPLASGPADFLPASVLLLPLLAGTAWGLARRSPVAFLGAWFFIILAPSSSVVPIVTEVAAEHRMYLPLLAPAILLVLGGERALAALMRRFPAGAPRLRRLGLAALGLWIASLGAISIRRNFDYLDEVRLWQSNARHAPHSARVLLSLGFALERAGRPREAEASYRRALERQPRSVDIRNNLALLLWERGEIRAAEELLRQAQDIDPRHPEAANSYGTLLAEQGRLDEAVARLESALSEQSNFRRSQICVNLGRVLLRRRSPGDIERAERVLRQAIEEEAEYDAGARFWLARALEESGRGGEALVILTELSARLPHEGSLHFARARLLLSAGRAREALHTWREAFRREPDPFGLWRDPA